MKVLNTYIETKCNGWLGVMFLFLLLAVVVYMLKDDITRFCEHHTIGAEFYKYMRYVWILPFAACIIFAVMSLHAAPVHKVMVEATIVDTYPIGALYEKYEIIDKRGDIWVLEQRPTWQEDVDKGSAEMEEE